MVYKIRGRGIRRTARLFNHRLTAADYQLANRFSQTVAHVGRRTFIGHKRMNAQQLDFNRVSYLFNPTSAYGIDRAAGQRYV
jgi:hypothetical protein